MKTISDLKNNKATGPGSINTKILKLISPTVSQMLTDIINDCFSDGIFPTYLKSGNITPLHKKDSKLLASNFRPISLLSNISKIFEKLIHKRLYSYLEKNNIIYDFQFGFRKGHSTNHALITLTEAIRSALDSNEYAVGIFLDLQKAFDTVEHSILIKKLEHYGIRGTENDLLKSYLTGRCQCVKSDDIKSDQIEIKHGVPQGSVLGPLLFLLYINDLHNVVKHSSTFHYADDTSLLCKGKSLKNLNKHVNQDLKLLTTWLRANKISLNTSKTELIIFRSPNKPLKKNLNFRISGQHIFPTSQVTYLGVQLQEHLNWNSYMNELIPKLARATGVISKLRHYVDYKTGVSIYYSMFNAHVIYSIQAWGFISADSLDRITRLQNKALRLLNFKDLRAPTKPLFINTKILPISYELKLRNCLLAFDILRKLTPVKPLLNFLKLVSQNHDYNTKSSDTDVVIDQSRTIRFGSYSIKTIMAKNWNNIIPNLKVKYNDVSKTTLSNHIKAYLFYSMV